MAEHNRQIKADNGDLIYPINRVSAILDFDTEAHIVNRNQSAGVVTQPTLTDNLNGTFTVGNFTARLFQGPGFLGDIRMYSIAGATFTPVDLTLNFLVVNYNGGAPIAQVITNVELIDEAQIIPVSTIYRHGTHIHHLMWDSLGLGLSNKLNQRFVKTQRFARETGLMISEYPTRQMRVTAGKVWYGAVRVDLVACDSGVEPFHLYYHVGGVYPSDSTHITQYNNTQYDDGTGLQTTTPNKYLINWIYRGVEEEPHVYVVLGIQAYSTLNEAAIAQPRTDIPDEIKAHAMLIGKIVVIRNGTVAAAILSTFDVSFTVAGGVTNHNDLAGLQGGVAAEYYHLTNAEMTKFTDLTDGGDTPLHTHKSIVNEVSVDNAKVEALATGVKITKNTNDSNVALVVDQKLGTGYIQEWRFAGSGKAGVQYTGAIFSNNTFQTDFGLTNSTGGSANAYFNSAVAGPKISRNIADSNPALIVDQVNASSTGDLLKLRKAGLDTFVFDIYGNFACTQVTSKTGYSNGRVALESTGVTILRDMADTNTALKINQKHASSTGLITDFQFGGVSKASVSKDGKLSTASVDLVTNLNSDLLDSQHGSHYLARANHTGTQSADTIVDGTTNHVFTAADDTKLAGIEAGAEVNNISDLNATDLTDAGDSALHYHATDRARANHTGTQSADTIVDGSTNHVFTAADDTKLAGIATGANLYVHPATHSADIIVDGTTNKAYTATEKTKLAGIAAGAQVNNISDLNATDLTDAGDSALHYHSTDRARANHTGTQSADTVVDGATNKVYTATEKTKLAGIESGATADMTAAEILTAIKTVDGAGSGLDADLLDGLASGNASGNIPISNGTVNTNLNAEKTGGSTLAEIIAAAVTAAKLATHPIGSVYTSIDPTDPGTLFGGTWTTFANGRTLVGWYSADPDFDTAEDYGGEKDHILTIPEMPNHNHGLNNANVASSSNLYNEAFSKAYGGNAFTGNTGGGLAHNNMPPYMVVYMWKRTA